MSFMNQCAFDSFIEQFKRPQISNFPIFYSAQVLYMTVLIFIFIPPKDSIKSLIIIHQSFICNSHYDPRNKIKHVYS